MPSHQRQQQVQVEVKPKAGNASTKICREWQKNRKCRFGERCRFSHNDLSLLPNTEEAAVRTKDTKPSLASASTRSLDKRPKKAKQLKWSMQPSRHQDVLHLLQDSGLSFRFHNLDELCDCTQMHDTNIMGRFECHNRACASKGWSSKMIAISIRLYGHSRYNARVYHQRCRSCNRLSRPSLDDSYAERIAYRLKKWSGIEMEPPENSGPSKGPHQSELCEGCKDGHCSQKSS